MDEWVLFFSKSKLNFSCLEASVAWGFYLKVRNKSANSHKILSSFVILQLFNMTGFIPTVIPDQERITHSNFPNNSCHKQYNQPLQSVDLMLRLTWYYCLGHCAILPFWLLLYQMPVLRLKMRTECWGFTDNCKSSNDWLCLWAFLPALKIIFISLQNITNIYAIETSINQACLEMLAYFKKEFFMDLHVFLITLLKLMILNTFPIFTSTGNQL